MPLAKEILSSTSPVGDTDNGNGGASAAAAAASAAAAGQQNTDTLRGKAMEAIALMGQAVGLEVFRSDAHQASTFFFLVMDGYSLQLTLPYRRLYYRMVYY